MNKLKKLRLCDFMLLAVALVMLASSLQLEVIAGQSMWWVWVHIVSGTLFLVLILWHLQLHFQWRNWLRLLWKQRSANMKWLTAVGILTFVTALVATAGWIASPEHSKIGAVHGKLGFLFIALAVWHTARRFRFYIR